MATTGGTVLKLWGCNALGMGVGVLSSALLARLLTAEEIGVLALGSSLAAFFLCAFLSWLLAPFIRFGKESLGHLGSVWPAWRLKVPLLLVAIGCIVILTMPPVMGLWSPLLLGLQSSWSLSALVCFGILSLWAQEEVLVLSQIHERFDLVAALSLGQKVLWCLVLAAIFLSSVHYGSYALLVISWTSGLIVSIVIVTYLRFSLPVRAPQGQPNLPHTSRTMALHCMPAVLASTVGFFSSYGDHWLINLRLNTAEVGLFQLAYQLFSIVNGLAITFSMVFLPRVIREETSTGSHVEHNFRRLFPVIQFFWLMLLLGLGVILPEAFRVVYTSRYENAVPALMILLTGSSFSVLTALFSPYFHVQSRIRQSAIIVILMVIVNLTISWFLLPMVGLIGSAFGTAVSYWVGGVLYIFDQHRHYEISEKTTLTMSAFVVVVQFVLATLYEHFLLRMSIAVIAAILLIALARRCRLFSWFDFDTLPLLPAFVRSGLAHTLSMRDRE